jgi:hypothetical protein
MTRNSKTTFIERMAEKLGLIPDLHKERDLDLPSLTPDSSLTKFPPMDQWDDWTEYEATEHPKTGKAQLHHCSYDLFQL